MQNWYKNVFLDATVLFQLPYLNFFVEPWLRDSNRRSSPPKYNLRTPWATEQTYRLKPIDMKLDMCDGNDQKHQFSNLPAY